MVILKLIEFLFIAFVILFPILCVGCILVKSGIVENKPGNAISWVFDMMRRCFALCKCRKTQGVYEV